MKVDITAHKIIDSLTRLLELLFDKSPVVASIVTIIIVITPVYHIHIRGAVGRNEKLNDQKLKKAVQEAIAKRAKKPKKISKRKGGKA